MTKTVHTIWFRLSLATALALAGAALTFFLLFPPTPPSQSAAAPPLRRAILRTLAACRTLMPDARALPAVLKSRHLAMESAVIVRIADRLLDELEARDPVAERVELTRVQFALCGIGGALSGFFR